MGNIKSILLKSKRLSSIILPVWRIPKELRWHRKAMKELRKAKGHTNRIFYLGVPAHANLGDLAQGVCIRRWIRKHYPDNVMIALETNALVNTHFSVLNKLKKIYRREDRIIFQSGYTTTDLGGYADEMHRAVMETLPQARMLMLPQTVYFREEKNKLRTSQCYNSMKNMLFLARDRNSYQMAQEMFPDIPVKQYPDIVTTLIGNYRFDGPRKGILFCCRDDEEKFYSDEEINQLMKRCAQLDTVDRTDTTKKGNLQDIVAHAETMINNEIRHYAQYKVIITDRYHGTILSLVAGTPVIIIKTTDHKVTTGAEWFWGVYDGYVHLAQTLDEAYEIAQTLLAQEWTYTLPPYFEQEYYDKLPGVFAEAIGDAYGNL